MKTKFPPFKTKYIAYVATSIDGRISLSKNELPNWTSKEDWRFFQKYLARADAVVVGRNTYKVVAERLRKRNTFVISNHLQNSSRRGSVHFVNPHNVDIAKMLSQYKTVAVVGGAGVYSFMLNNHLLDEIFVTIEPLLFGRGLNMLAEKNKTPRLKLISMKKLNKHGTILLHYKINYK